MGFSVAQVHFLALTRRKADCELGLSRNATRKMQYTREMNDLAREYSSKLGQKQVIYYENGNPQEINYSYLMGYGNFTSTLNALVEGDRAIKDNNKMILTDPNGKVVLSDRYANAITSICGVGHGETFSEDYIPNIIAELCPGYSLDDIQTGVTQCNWTGTATNTLGESHQVEGDSSESATSALQTLIDFYVPIFKAAAINGWTTEYNASMAQNPHYLTDALASGTLILAEIDESGYYEENENLTYFATAGDIELRTNASRRAEIEAEYEAKRAEITEKEELLDLDITDLNAELEAIKTEMESVKTFINDAIQSVFSWGTGS